VVLLLLGQPRLQQSDPLAARLQLLLQQREGLFVVVRLVRGGGSSGACLRAEQGVGVVVVAIG